MPRKEFNNNWDLAFGSKSQSVPEANENVGDSEHPIQGETKQYGVSILEKFRKSFMFTQKLKDHLEPFETFGEYNRGSRESENTPEASGSTIQPPS